MKTILIVQRKDAFTGEGWIPVRACDSKDEADGYIIDQKKNNETYECRGIYYQIVYCTYVEK